MNNFHYSGKKRRLFFIILFSLILLSGCADKKPSANIVTLNIAFQNWVGYGPFYLAQEKGFCEEEGIRLNFIDEQLDSARRDAFKQGMLDFEAGTIDLLISKVAQDTPIIAIMQIDYSFGADGIVADKNIKKLKDLIGKTVVLARDDVGETLLSYVFHKQGLPFEKVKILPSNSEQVAEVFINSKADACVTWEPQLSEALKKPGAHILADTKDYPNVIIDVLNVKKSLLDKDLNLVKGVMRAWFKALKYYRDNPVESSEIIAKYYNISPTEYVKQVEGLRWVNYQEQDDPSKLKEWMDIFNVVSEIKFRNFRITKLPVAKECINLELLKELYEYSE